MTEGHNVSIAAPIAWLAVFATSMLLDTVLYRVESPFERAKACLRAQRQPKANASAVWTRHRHMPLDFPLSQAMQLLQGNPL